MPKIDFYILNESHSSARLQLACRLIEKAYKQKHRIYIHTENSNDAHQLDELLWTYREDSFLPHNLLGDGPEPAPPIQIGFTQPPEKHRDILINLAHQVPEFHIQFNRILELVDQNPIDQESARERFRFYRNQQFSIRSTTLYRSYRPL